MSRLHVVFTPGVSKKQLRRGSAQPYTVTGFQHLLVTRQRPRQQPEVRGGLLTSAHTYQSLNKPFTIRYTYWFHFQFT